MTGQSFFVLVTEDWVGVTVGIGQNFVLTCLNRPQPLKANSLVSTMQITYMPVGVCHGRLTENLQIARTVKRLCYSIATLQVDGHLEWVDLGIRLLSHCEQFPDCDAKRPLTTNR